MSTLKIYPNRLRIVFINGNPDYKVNGTYKKLEEDNHIIINIVIKRIEGRKYETHEAYITYKKANNEST